MPEPTDDDRLRVLRSTRLLDSPPERAFDRLTRMAARLLNAPAALVTLVDETRQFFKSSYGLREPWASQRETPLSHSFCQYATRDRAPLVVNDAREHPILRDNLALRDLDVVAYAGIPLFVHDQAIGAFCVVDSKPRVWSEDELRTLTDLADSVVSEIELRLALRVASEQRALTDALLDSFGDGVLAIDTNRTFILANAAARRVFAEGAEVGQRLPANWAALHRSTLPDGSSLPAENGALSRALRGENTDGLEFTLERPGARAAAWVEASGRPVRGPDGDVIAGVAVYRDVTERKRRADLYTTLASNIPHAAVVLFDHELKCVALDGGMLRADGVDPRAMIGLSMRELAGESGRGNRFDAIDDAYRRTLAGDSVSLDFMNGAQTLALHTAPVRDGLGRVTAGIVLALDVTDQRSSETAVRRSEQLYRAIVQNVPNAAVFMVDRDLRYVSADGPALRDTLAASPIPFDDLIGHTVDEVVSGDNRVVIVEILRATLEGKAQRRELSHADHVYELVTEPLADENGEVSLAVLFCFDITERMRAHAAIERERALFEQFREFVEQIPTGISVLRQGRIAYVNRAMLRILGYEDASSLIGREAVEIFIHPDDRSEVGARMRSATLEAVAPRRTRCLRRDGTTVIIETTARPFVFDGAPSVISVSRDMTDEVRADVVRRELIATLEVFRLMVEGVRDYAIFQLDRDGCVRTWNKGARAIKGYETREIVGKHISIFYPAADKAKASRALEVAASVGRYEEEGWRVRKDGTQFWASGVITALHSNGVLEGFAKVTRDHTERRKQEEELLAKQTALVQSVKEREVLLQEIHHRVKNNLQVISSLINMQVRKLEDPATRSALEECQTRVLAIALIHEKLYQSKDYSQVHFADYARSLAANVFHTTGVSQQAVSLELAIDEIPLGVDRAIPCGLVVNELITNALKHGFKDGRTGKIRVELRRVDDGRLRLIVKDDGIGLPDGFDIRKTESMGLQLVCTLAEQLEGDLVVASENGASFQLTFAGSG